MSDPEQTAASIEHFGPIDARPIPSWAVDAVAHDFTKSLRVVRQQDGHRAAVGHAIAAVVSGAVMIGELAGDELVVEVLRRQIAIAEQRIEQRAAGMRPMVMQ